MKFTFKYAIWFWMLGVSCNQDLKEQFKEPARLVLNADFSADSSVKVRLGQSFDLFASPENRDLSNADIRLFEAGGVAVHFTETSPGIYELPTAYQLFAGNDYEIEVRWQDFAPLHARCTIPHFPNIGELDTFRTASNLLLYFDLTDPSEENFYLMELLGSGWWYDLEGEFKKDSQYRSIPLNFNSNRDDLRLVSLQSFSGEQQSFALFKDALFNGEEQRVNLSIPIEHLISTDTFSVDSVSLLFSSVSKDTYRYLLSVQENSVYIGSSLGSSANLYSNVVNGLGILSASAVRKQGIRLSER